ARGEAQDWRAEFQSGRAHGGTELSLLAAPNAPTIVVPLCPLGRQLSRPDPPPCNDAPATPACSPRFPRNAPQELPRFAHVVPVATLATAFRRPRPARGVFEQIGCVRRRALSEQQTGLNNAVKCCSEFWLWHPCYRG